MIVALFCVAAAMIAGGVWAVFTGWELIIIERGWTQVLLGGMLFTGGMLLCGVGVLAVHVRRLTRKLDQTASPAKPLLAGDAIPARRNEMPPTPSPEPRQPVHPEPETAAQPFSTPAAETERPAASTISAPAALALGAAAGAGTAAIASAILTSSDDPKPTAEPAAGEQDSGEHLFADIDEPEEPAPSDTASPTPDGEDAGMSAEGADTDTRPAMDAETGELAEGEEHVIPPLEETARLELPEEGEREPFSEQEELYSAPAEDLDEEALSGEDRTTLPEAPDGEEEQAALRAEEGSMADHEASPIDAPGQEETAVAPEAEGEEVVEQEVAEHQVEHEVPEQEPAPRSLVGTYESGGNVYTMYSDGSIDAQTPSGAFHFASLEELKNFIAEGGEDPVA